MAEPRDLEKSAIETVIETNRDVQPSLQKQRTAQDKLGIWNIIVLSVGTALILIPVGFLVWFWWVSLAAVNRTEHDFSLWNLIATRQWGPRMITLCVILIRVATGAQLCIFAAIMAALILERVGASSQDFPLLSMMRCANTGPQALIWYVYHTMKSRSQLVYTSMIVITILNAFALQFTSTMLLADVKIATVVTNITHGFVGYGLTVDAVTNYATGIDYWYEYTCEVKQEAHPNSFF